jgi:hypothetical protein
MRRLFTIGYAILLTLCCALPSWGQEITSKIIVQNELLQPVTGVRVRLSARVSPTRPASFEITDRLEAGEQAERDLSSHARRFIWAQLEYRVNGRTVKTAAYVVKAGPDSSSERYVLQVIFRIRSDDGSLSQAQIDEGVRGRDVQLVTSDQFSHRISKGLSGELHVAEPVWLYGPFPTIQYACKVDVYAFQVRYPITPGSLPVRVDLFSNSPAAIPTDAVLSSGQLAVLNESPQSGTGLGVGYLIVFVKAFRQGQATATVDIEKDDGSHERVASAMMATVSRPHIADHELASGLATLSL